MESSKSCEKVPEGQASPANFKECEELHVECEELRVFIYEMIGSGLDTFA